VATFNVSLHRAAAGELIADLETGTDDGARCVAEIIQRVRPDVLLLNEIDHDEDGRAVDLFRRLYLERGWNGAEPIVYEHVVHLPSNTGVLSGRDLDRDGRTDGPGDAFGFGAFPGQYGMALLSRRPIRAGGVRSFRRFPWKDMPDAMLPDDPATEAPGDWYGPETLAVLPLSSKSHWDVPVEVGDGVLHLLCSHPTPPVFDGPEDRNGRRNHDEIRFWADYVDPRRAAYVRDDAGRPGGLAAGAAFVVLGDLNADPRDGDTTGDPVRALLAHPLIAPGVVPTSAGGAERALVQGGANEMHRGDPAADTADFRDEPGPGNLRVDYVLPSATLAVAGAGVFWPAADDPHAALVEASDHRLVWVDLVLAPPRERE
jgi:endonuclease/exonuclease/phosphatase family metal-dependent hydrolase